MHSECRLTETVIRSQGNSNRGDIVLERNACAWILKGLLGSLAKHYCALPSQDEEEVKVFGSLAWPSCELRGQALACSRGRAILARLNVRASRNLCHRSKARRGQAPPRTKQPLSFPFSDFHLGSGSDPFILEKLEST